MAYYVYHHFGDNDEALYVGRTKNWKTRQIAHKSNSPWFNLIVRHEVTRCKSYLDSIKQEKKQIELLRPKHNKHHNYPPKVILPQIDIPSKFDYLIVEYFGGPKMMASHLGRGSEVIARWGKVGFPKKIKKTLHDKYYDCFLSIQNKLIASVK